MPAFSFNINFSFNDRFIYILSHLCMCVFILDVYSFIYQTGGSVQIHLNLVVWTKVGFLPLLYIQEVDQ